jgi:two-component system response regulator MprA
MTQPPVLIVEDDPDIRQFLRLALEQEGYLALTAENGQVALDLVMRQPPGLILLDLSMPIMDGWTFARTLKERGFDIPIVVMTAERNGRSWSQQIAAAAHLAKPVDLDLLLATIERVRSRIQADPTSS